MATPVNPQNATGLCGKQLTIKTVSSVRVVDFRVAITNMTARFMTLPDHAGVWFPHNAQLFDQTARQLRIILSFDASLSNASWLHTPYRPLYKVVLA